MSPTSTVHTILGANGVIGRELSRLLPAQGIRVRQVGRTPRAVNDGDDVVAADLLDEPTCHRRRRRGKCGGVPAGRPEVRHEGLAGAVADRHAQRHRRLHAPRDGPRLLRQRLRLRPRGRPDDGRDPVQPVQRKGEVRARIATTFMDEVRRGALRGMIVRAADFYGPGATLSLAQATVVDRLRAGKSPQWIGDRDACTRSPTRRTPAARWRSSAPPVGVRPGVARADQQGRHDGHHVHAHRLRGGRPAPRAAGGARWMLRLMGVFVPVLRENMEMLYQFERAIPVRQQQGGACLRADSHAVPRGHHGDAAGVAAAADLRAARPASTWRPTRYFTQAGMTPVWMSNTHGPSSTSNPTRMGTSSTLSRKPARTIADSGITPLP